MLTPFMIVRGPALPLLLANIDTDLIIRIEWLTQTDQSDLGRHALETLRFGPDGELDSRSPLNQHRYSQAPILLAGPNFGCGSSREAAVWALGQRGFRVVIAPSFGDIFHANCFQNGVLPVRLDEATIGRLASQSRAPHAVTTVDLRRRLIVSPDQDRIPFEVDPSRREALLAGLDDIGLTLLDLPHIAAWQATDAAARPWVWTLPT